MVEKEIQQTRVIYWYHRRFIEVASSHYISKLNSTEREKVFTNVVDFFNETWKKTPKPYKYNEYVAQKKNLSGNQAQEIRDTTVQTTSYINESGKKVYNKRKIHELPGFLSNLTTNLSVKFFCECVFFNYDFLSGMLHCLNITELYDNVTKASEASAYKLSEEVSESLNDLKLIKLIFLQIGASMADYPSSGVAQLISKSLKFYGISNNFSRLIDEYDKNSLNDCSLIVPYQYLHAPGGDMIFQLEKHLLPITACSIGGDNDSYVFSLSDKLNLFNMGNLEVIGDIPVLSTNGPYKTLITYISSEDINENENLQLRNMSGGFIVANENNIISYSFDSAIYFHKSFETQTVGDLFLISPRHVVVAFKNEKYLNIYDICSGQTYLTERFDEKVEKIYCNTYKNYIIDVKKFKNDDVLLSVLVNSMKLTLFKVSISNDGKNIITLDKYLEIPSPGFDVISLIYFDDKGSLYDFNSLGVIVTFSDGSLALVDLEKKRLKCFKPQIKNNENIQFKLLEYKSISQMIMVLLLGSNKSIYVFYYEENRKKIKLIEIPGNFDNGYILKENKIACCKKGILYYYQIQIFETNYSFININKINAHYDDITFSFVKDMMLLTASLDSTIKVFVTSRDNLEDDRKDDSVDFDALKTKINKLCVIDKKHVISIDESGYF